MPDKVVSLTARQEELRQQGLRILARMIVGAFLTDMAEVDGGDGASLPIPSVSLARRRNGMSRSPVRARVLLKAQALWDLMQRLNISQNQLARAMGTTSGYLADHKQ